MTTTQNKMGWMSMPKLVMTMSLPLMVSLLIQSLYNIVDSIFIARFSQDALTATSLAYPMQLLMISVTVGTSVGINALLSKSIGAKKVTQTTNVATTGVLLAIIGTLLFVTLALTNVDYFVALFTHDALIADDCAKYLSICMLWCGGTFIGTMFQRFLQATGNTFGSMLTLVAGAVTNIILDPLLIFGLCGLPTLGITGAAIATVCGQWVAAVTAVLLNKLKNPLVQPRIKGFRLEKQILIDIYRVGLPTIITQALGSLMVSAVNAILMPFSATAVAFFGVYYKLQSFLFMPMNGLGQATIPIVGFNYGANQTDRILSVYRTTVPIAAAIALVATLFFLAAPTWLLHLFSADAQMLALGVPALRIISITFVPASITMILGYAASGLGSGVINMMGTALRQLLLLVPTVYVLANIAGLSMIWYAFWLSELAAIFYALLASKHLLKKKRLR